MIALESDKIGVWCYQLTSMTQPHHYLPAARSKTLQWKQITFSKQMSLLEEAFPWKQMLVTLEEISPWKQISLLVRIFPWSQTYERILKM